MHTRERRHVRDGGKEGVEHLFFSDVDPRQATRGISGDAPAIRAEIGVDNVVGVARDGGAALRDAADFEHSLKRRECQ